MKIALLHYTAWPDFGGVEHVVRDQAITLIRHDHEVLVISGSGEDPGDGYAFATLPELAYDYPLNVEVRKVLETGQYDQNFNKYRKVLADALKPALAEIDLLIVHDVFTMHHNLPLTAALHDLSSTVKMVAWTHDLTASNTDYALPNPDKMPWNMVRTSTSKITYVAVSDVRRDELEKNLKPQPSVTVIPNVVDQGRLFNLTPEMRESLEALALEERDYVFLTPARVTPRKNIDFAIELTRLIKEKGRNPLLLITGAAEAHSNAAAEYGKYLRASLPEILYRHVVFVNDYFPVKEEMMRDLYALADCLLFPSKREGFGLPVIEAALHRMPIWCSNVPAFRALQGEGAFLIEQAAQLDDAIAWLEAQPVFRLHRRARQAYDMRRIYREHYTPFLNSFSTPLPNP